MNLGSIPVGATKNAEIKHFTDEVRCFFLLLSSTYIIKQDCKALSKKQKQ